jgi:hypothetical protein
MTERPAYLRLVQISRRREIPGVSVRIAVERGRQPFLRTRQEAVVSAERAKNRACPDIILCPECHAVLPKPKPPICPQCEHVFFAVTPYQERDGELVQFGSCDRGDSRITDETKRHWYASFLWICDEKGKKRGHAFYLFQDRFKEKPPYSWRATVIPVSPNVEQRNFVRRRAIAYAKARARE